MRRRSISITDDTWVKIKLHAVASGRTPSQVVEEACRRLLVDRYGPATGVNTANRYPEVKP